MYCISDLASGLNGATSYHHIALVFLHEFTKVTLCLKKNSVGEIVHYLVNQRTVNLCELNLCRRAILKLIERVCIIYRDLRRKTRVTEESEIRIYAPTLHTYDCWNYG
jgi:hypothetical protein